MRTDSYTIGANEEIQVGSGNFFQFLRGDDPIEVTFWRGKEKLNNESTKLARPGYVAKPPRALPRGSSAGYPVGFTSAIVKSPTAQTIEIGVSDGEGAYQRFTGDVSVISPLNSNNYVQVVQADDVNGRTPSTTLVGATATQVSGGASEIALKASNNTNGAIIRHAMVQTRQSGTSDENSRAEIQVDGTSLLKVMSRNEDNSAGGSSQLNVRDIHIPSGVAITLDTLSIGSASIWVHKL
jgi:hypothetical protein